MDQLFDLDSKADERRTDSQLNTTNLGDEPMSRRNFTFSVDFIYENRRDNKEKLLNFSFNELYKL